MSSAVSAQATSLNGHVRPPGDKSMSHRALMFGALAVGTTRIQGLLDGEDVRRTAAAMSALGADISLDDQGIWTVRGRGVGGLSEPEDVLDMGNSGTGARLLMGILAGHPFTSFLTGDDSLRGRPMERVMAPLREMGAQFTARSAGRLPLAITGTDNPMALEYRLPVSSAQVKSAVLLAGLHGRGETVVIEPKPSRDHTELMLKAFGATVSMSPLGTGERTITLVGQPELRGTDITVPADPSSAAFPLVAALIVPGSTVTVGDVGTNPLRAGLLDCLREMGADLTMDPVNSGDGEPMARLRVVHGGLKAITVPADRAPSMIDEYPILAVAAAFAKGTTRMEGLAELRVKESDRLTAMAEGLAACGVSVRAGADWLEVDGTGAPPAGGAHIAARLDHRIAMSFLVLGMGSKEPVTVDDVATVATSFPGFVDMMNGLGSRITVTGNSSALEASR